MSGNTVLLGYVGTKTGKQYLVPVNFVRVAGEDGDHLLVTSERGRTWWRSLRGGSAVEVYLSGTERKGIARSLEDADDVEAGLMTYLSHAPGNARYFKVALDEDGEPRLEDVVRAAHGRVIIEVDLS